MDSVAVKRACGHFDKRQQWYDRESSSSQGSTEREPYDTKDAKMMERREWAKGNPRPTMNMVEGPVVGSISDKLIKIWVGTLDSPGKEKWWMPSSRSTMCTYAKMLVVRQPQPPKKHFFSGSIRRGSLEGRNKLMLQINNMTDFDRLLGFLYVRDLQWGRSLRIWNQQH